VCYNKVEKRRTASKEARPHPNAAEALGIPFRRVEDLGGAISIKKGSPKKGGKEMDYLSRPSYHYKPQRGWINDPPQTFALLKLDISFPSVLY
jgi:hypothetical protein